MASTPERLLTTEEIPRRSHEHTELVAALADLGHRIGHAGLDRRARPDAYCCAARSLAHALDERELRVNLTSVVRAPEEDARAASPASGTCARSSRSPFELEWTAMLGESVLRRHARIPPDDRLVRFLVVAPERTELVRYKLERSPLLRQSIEAGNWHILKSNHLRELADRDDGQHGGPGAATSDSTRRRTAGRSRSRSSADSLAL